MSQWKHCKVSSFTFQLMLSIVKYIGFSPGSKLTKGKSLPEKILSYMGSNWVKKCMGCAVPFIPLQLNTVLAVLWTVSENLWSVFCFCFKLNPHPDILGIYKCIDERLNDCKGFYFILFYWHLIFFLWCSVLYQRSLSQYWKQNTVGKPCLMLDE